MQLLHIDSSITGEASASRQISAALVKALIAGDPTLDVVRRDLAVHPAKHLDGAALRDLAENEVLYEFLQADMLVIGAPMYNFGMASPLKAWFDHVLVAGRTFRYGPDGPQGLATGKTAFVASARGGVYAPGTPAAALDFHEPHLLHLLRLMGIDDVKVVRAEGLALGAEARDAAVGGALLEAASSAGRSNPRRVA